MCESHYKGAIASSLMSLAVDKPLVGVTAFIALMLLVD